MDLGKGEMFVTRMQRNSVRGGIHLSLELRREVGLRDDIATLQLDPGVLK